MKMNWRFQKCLDNDLVCIFVAFACYKDKASPKIVYVMDLQTDA